MSLLTPNRPVAGVDDLSLSSIKISEASHSKKLLVWSTLVLVSLALWTALILIAIALVS